VWFLFVCFVGLFVCAPTTTNKPVKRATENTLPHCEDGAAAARYLFFVCYHMVLFVVEYFILLYCVLVCNSYCLFFRFGEGAGAAKCLCFACSCVVFVCLFCWFVCLCPHHHKRTSEASNRKYTYRTAETELQQPGICFLFATIWYYL